MHHKPGGPPKAGGILAALGGILIGISAVLDWGTVSNRAGQSAPVEGGTAILFGSGAVALILGLALMVVTSRGARIAIAILSILGGLLGLLVTSVALVTDDFFVNTVLE